MNRLVTKFIILIIPFLAISCDEINVDDPIKTDYFMKFYGNYHNDNLYDIKVTQSEEIILAGYRKLTDESEEAWIIKTGNDGMVNWEKVFSGTNNFRGYGLYVDDIINYAGYELIPGSTIQKGFLCQYNMDGTLIDSLSYDIIADEVKDIKFLANNSNLRFIVHVALNSSDEIYIFEITPGNEINLISANKLYSTVEGSLYFFEQENGNLYLSGSIQEVGNPGYTDIMVSRIVDDNIIWSYHYGNLSEIEKASGIVLLDNSLYVSATKLSNEGSLYVMQMDASGLNAQNVDIEIAGDNTSYSMIVNSQNEFVIVGERILDINNSKIFMSRIALDGQVLLDNEYGNTGFSKGRFVLNLEGVNKGFIIAGDVTTAPDSKDVLVVKADESGQWIN